MGQVECAGSWIRGPFLGIQDLQKDTRPGYVKIAIENGPVEIVDLPSYKMVIFQFVM